MSYNIRLRRQIVFEAWDQLYSSVRLIIFQTKTKGANYRRILSRRVCDHTSRRGSIRVTRTGVCYLRPVRMDDKPWLKVLLADLLWEKNIFRWLEKYGFIREANVALVFFYVVKVVSRWPARQGIQILYIVWAILYPDHAMQHPPISFCW